MRLPFSRFLKTYRGRVVETESDMNTRTVLSLGLSLAGGGVLEPPGPYRLEVERIRAA